METVWFWIVAGMITTYVVLDGFDFGVGILHWLVAKTDEERRTVLASIGPVWDGNEVWLVAGGGILFFAFPRVYAAGFSGFYLPLMVVLWLIILRGLAIEFRSKEENPLWRSFWDGTFIFSSTFLAFVLGAALGNVIRGVSLDREGYFSNPLFTTFGIGPYPGVLDWYTLTVGLFTLFVLAGHGALYLTWKTTGPVHDRSRALAPKLWTAATALGVLATAGTAMVRPMIYGNLLARPLAWPLVILIPVCLGLVFVSHARGREMGAFLASCGFIAAMLASTAAGFYPYLLISTLDPAHSLTVTNASTSPLGMRYGLMIWIPAILLAVGYFTYLFWSFRGKVDLHGGGYGH
jgi:cytochrome bd ubiquinol oxidase subunit II